MVQGELLLIWESEAVTTTSPAGENRAVVTAKRPLARLSVRQAAQVLGCCRDAVWRAYRAGLIEGWKPGAISVRKDGRRSNAALVLDAGSVLRYKERRRCV